MPDENDRKITFIGAGEQDISEVTISSGTHTVETASSSDRVTYTISYPEQRPGSRSLAEQFQEAAEAVEAEIKKDETEDITPDYQ